MRFPSKNDIENKSHVERVRESLQKHKIRDFITYCILYVRSKRDLNASNVVGKRRLTRFAERMLEKDELDILLSCCLQISRILIFEQRVDDNVSRNPARLDDASIKKANLLLADFLFGASVSLANDKEQSKNKSSSLHLTNNFIANNIL